MTSNPVEPREPEIEFLGRLASRVLALLRVVLFVAGIVAIAVACYLTELGHGGLSQVMLLPPLAAKDDVLRDVAEHVMPLLE